MTVLRSLGRTAFGCLLVFTVATVSCRARAGNGVSPAQALPSPSASMSAPPKLPLGPSAFCKRGFRPPHGALKVEWQAEDKVRSLQIDTSGRVLSRGVAVASISGGCLWAIDGKALMGTNSRSELIAQNGSRIGTFTPRATLKIDDNDIAVDEVLTMIDGTAKAIANDGSVYLAPKDVPAFTLPATVKGDIARGRRTAFMLFAFGQSISG